MEDGVQEAELQSGVNPLGRHPENTVTIPHGSVSGRHCELILEEDGLRVRDLGSTNGTYVDEQPVVEAWVQLGQRIRFGEVVCDWIPGEKPRSTGPIRLKVNKPAQGTDSAARPSIDSGDGDGPKESPWPPRPATAPDLYCEHCGKSVGREEAKKRQAGRQILYFCPECNTRCVGLEEFAAKRMPVVEETFGKALMASFKYPLQPDGLLMLGTGAVFFTALHGALFVSGFAGLIGLIAVVILTVFITGYLFSFLKSVLLVSSQGEDKIPDWPDFNSIGQDIVGPFLQFVGLMVFSFGPALLWLLFGPEEGRVVGGIGLFLFGLLYFPMGLLAVSMFDSLLALNPLLIVTSILKILGHYLIMLFFIGAVLVLRFLGGVASETIPIPIVPALLAELFTLYFFMVIMRAMGRMYRIDKRKLGWFKK